MKIAVTIATYKRSDGKTPFYLKRCLDSVFSQSFRDFKVFLAGDMYDDVREWERLITPYEGSRFYSVNFPTPGEREKYKNDKRALWCTGGTKACNKVIDVALDQEYEYVCHLDHDDYWAVDHLRHINNCIETLGADWVCTRSTYGKGTVVLPQGVYEQRMVPFLPVPGGVINSATCYNYKTIPLRGEDTVETRGIAIPADADLWDRMRKYMEENGKKGYLVNLVTCFHAEEGYTYR